MKQFAQCANCHQWYTRTATAAVEIYQGDHLHCIALWCLGCIQDAERRSVGHAAGPQAAAFLTPRVSPEELALPETLQQLMEEHLHLMDRALHDEEDILVPVVHNFIERANLYQAQAENPAPHQRLLGHVHYWETFLKALHTHG